MFMLRFRRGFIRMMPATTQSTAETPGRAVLAGGFLRLAVLLASLPLGLPRTLYAQALGTMQVTARVVPAAVAWDGVAEAREAAQSAALVPSGRPLVLRGRLIQTRAEIWPSAGPGLLVVTIHHLHN